MGKHRGTGFRRHPDEHFVPGRVDVLSDAELSGPDSRSSLITQAPERATFEAHADVDPTDFDPANWLIKGLCAVDDYRIGSVIPDSFSAYARVEHERGPGHRRPSRQLPEQALRIVYNLLSDATTTPERCWFSVWEADRRLRARTLRHRLRGPTENQLGLPRAFHLYMGKLSDLGPLRGFPWGLTPNLWWPEDRSWCVASETDFTWTYIGGSPSLISSVCEHPQLLAREVRPEDPVSP
jgi:hypothetical protein